MVIYLERTSQKPMDNVYLQYEILIAISRRERLKLLSDDIKKLLLDVKQKLLVPIDEKSSKKKKQKKNKKKIGLDKFLIEIIQQDALVMVLHAHAHPSRIAGAFKSLLVFVG
ncbi:hypothetical protein AtNW77_Chr2g0233371 [Arabidopsis thaliana]|uniref:Uncharacterized protein n=1 Tax=Arabidopsis thaliana x Arabidopsis arenosa TaxID=1240361 RepID=A0A8T2FJN4_9BRAS|nr:hypothetical protein ISN45_At02g009500 [Arabidopsis thaliana x Arabidopsis arenosa]